MFSKEKKYSHKHHRGDSRHFENGKKEGNADNKGFRGNANGSDRICTFGVPARKYYKSSYIPEPVKVIQQVKADCTICGKPITLIAESLHSRKGDGYVHFDCALDELKKECTVKPDEKISYVGMGKFAVVGRKQGTRSYEIRQTVEWENPESYRAMQKEVEDLKK